MTDAIQPYEPSLPSTVEQDAETPEGWRVQSVADLDFALLRIRELEAEVADAEAIRDTRIAEIQARTERLTKRARWLAGFFRSHITAYAQEHREELLGHGRKKSREFIHGSVAWRRKGGGLAVTDREALLAWARAQPVEAELVRAKEEPALDAIKRHYAATGEVPGGMDLDPERDEIVVKAVPRGGSDHE